MHLIEQLFGRKQFERLWWGAKAMVGQVTDTTLLSMLAYSQNERILVLEQAVTELQAQLAELSLSTVRVSRPSQERH